MNAKVSATARTKAARVLKVAGAVAALMLGSAAAFGEPHGGGGHSGGGGGGGHFSAGGGGGHFNGGHVGGGAHFAAPRLGGGPHFAGGAHFSAGQHYVNPGFHAGASVGFGGHGYAYGHAVGAYGYRPGWNGGYWHGGFWPRAYYGWSYPLYLGFLPALYATYWWGGVPYYYVNNVYYTYNPSDNGYVATDPPPVAGDYTDDVNAAAAAGAEESAVDNTPQDVSSVPNTGIIAYPRNGQSEQQQSTDKFQCHTWAKDQAGFDPTSQSSSGATGSARAAYGRAMAACLDARGYTVR